MLALPSGDNPPRWVILEGSSIDDVDFTGGKTLGELAGQLQQRGVVLGMADLRDSVRAELDRYGVTAKVGETRFFATAGAAVEAFRAEGDAGHGP